MGHDYSGSRVPGQVLFQPLEGFDVQVVGRLVQQQDIGVGHYDARKSGPRLLTST